MKKIILLVAFIGAVTRTFGQLDNRAFEDRMRVEEGDSGKLFFGFNMLGFSKDNEYNNAIVEGFTLFGYQAQPFVSYHPAKNLRIDAGVFLQKDFGNSAYTTITPTFSVKYQRKSFSLIFGNLEGSLNHRLIEPLYDFERVLNNRLENGLQAQINRDNLFLDVWIDWRKMIYVGDSLQEQLTAGMNLVPRILHRGNTDITIPIQFVTHHKGGEINFNHTGPIETLLNSAYGVEIKHRQNGFIQQMRLSGYYVYYTSVTGELQQAFKNGSGAYANYGISTKVGLDVMATYWYGHDYITIEGGKIYPSVSVFDGSRQQRTMQLLMLRMLYNIPVTNDFSAGARVEPFYDFSYKSFNYSIGVYLNFRERFFLWKKK